MSINSLLLASVVRAQWLMGTPCEIRALGPAAPEAVAAAFAEIARWDRVLSLYKEESELSVLNRRAATGPVVVSESLWEALAASQTLSRLTGGAFDPTVGALRSGGPVGFALVRLTPGPRMVSFAEAGVVLDPGGYGKGLALDHAARVLRERGVEAALINFGGQVYALGAPPGRPGWEVAVPGRPWPLVVRDASVSTSGDSERPGHILSPFTRKAVHRSWSVTVIAPTALEADAWSTAIYVLGRTPPEFRHCALLAEKAEGSLCRMLRVSPGKGDM